MKLIYYKASKNFGDAINPFVFEKLLPGFWDEDPDQVVLGIGSIIHLKVPEARQTIIFSSGYAYGKMPRIGADYDVICVRGPLTAQKLGIDPSLAITDGAALLKTFEWEKPAKKYAFSFFPHHESEAFYNWRELCEAVGYHYISPLDEPDEVFRQIQESEVVLAEAMHGAIVADTFRVPWVPVKIYPSINEFKWQDWTASLNMQYQPNFVRPLYNEDTLKKIMALKLERRRLNFLNATSTGALQLRQHLTVKKSTMRAFVALKEKPLFLSNESFLDSKVEKLLAKRELLQRTYSRTTRLT